MKNRPAPHPAPDLLRAHNIINSRQRQHPLQRSLPLILPRRITYPQPSIDWVRVNAACVAVADESDVAGAVREGGAAELVLQAGGPGLEGEEPGGEHGHGFELYACGDGGVGGWTGSGVFEGGRYAG